MTYWLKNGGSTDSTPLTAEQVVLFNPKRGEKLSKKNVFIGTDARNFIETMGLQHDSPELEPFFNSVFRFYEETTSLMIKYFKPTLVSKTMKKLEVISPKFQLQPLDINKDRWRYLVSKFPNIVRGDQIDDLMNEVSLYCRLTRSEPGQAVDEWWGSVADAVDEANDDKPLCPLLSRFALALCTMYNSSSEAERDFSKQTNIHQNTHVTNLSQKKLQCKLSVQSTIAMQATFCARCESALEERAERKKKNPQEEMKPYKCRHCHCCLLPPDKGLLDDLSNGKPCQRYKEEGLKLREENKQDNGPSSSKQVVRKDHIRMEVTKFRKVFQKKAEEEEKQKREAAKRKATSHSIPDTTQELKKRKREENKKKKEEKKEVIKKRLSFLY